MQVLYKKVKTITITLNRTLGTRACKRFRFEIFCIGEADISMLQFAKIICMHAISEEIKWIKFVDTYLSRNPCSISLSASFLCQKTTCKHAVLYENFNFQTYNVRYWKSDNLDLDNRVWCPSQIDGASSSNSSDVDAFMWMWFYVPQRDLQCRQWR